MTKEATYEEDFDSLWGDDGKLKQVIEEVPAVEDAPVVEEAPVASEDTVPTDGEAGTTPTNETENTQEVVEDPYAWMNELPDEVKEMAEQLKHQALSDRGRVSAYHRKVNELQGRLDATTQSRDVSTVTSDKDAADKYKSLEDIDNDAVTQLKEEYPELVGQIDALVQSRLGEAKNLFDESLTPLKEAQAQRAATDLRRDMDIAAAEIFNTKETGVRWEEEIVTDNFRNWISTQPQVIVDIVRESNNLDDTLYVLSQYERDYQSAMQSTTLPTDTPQKDTSQATSEADRVKQERADKLKTSVTPESTAVSSKQDVAAGDYDAMFEAMWGTKKTT